MVLRPKIELAYDLIENRFIYRADAYSFQTLYPFCNENVSGYLDFLDLKDKSLLTVGSSADQAISAIARGCKDITILDICPLTEPYFYLKKSAILSLPKDDFERLLFYRDYPRTFKYNKDPFNITAYPKLLETLESESPSSYDFWLTLSKTYSGEMIRKNLFTQDEEKPSTTRQLTDYLKTPESYEKTRELIRRIQPEFINANITHRIPTDKKFDNIVLSNLTTYLSYEQIKSLLESLIPHLNEGGKIILGYMYRTNEYSVYQQGWDVIYDMDRIKSIDENISVKSFQGVKGILHEMPSMKDSVYVYQKKK